jgi:hypothetical protein
MWQSLLVALWLLASSAVGQTAVARIIDGRSYIALADVATELGYSQSGGTDSLTVRTPQGALTVFAGSPDIFYRGAEVSLSVPVVFEGRWFAPLELYELLGFSLQGDRLIGAGQTLTLEFLPQQKPVIGSGYELIDLGNSVWGVSFYVSDGQGDENLSILVTDLALLSLVYPAQQRQFDAIMQRFTESKPLYFVASALRAGDWQPVFTLSQGGRSVELRHPLSVSLLAGSAERVTPQQTAVGVIEAPNWVNLRQPLVLTWGGVSATVQFRQ